MNRCRVINSLTPPTPCTHSLSFSVFLPPSLPPPPSLSLFRGLSSTVCRVVHRVTGEEYAVKIIDKTLDKALTAQIRSEIDILQQVAKHENISKPLAWPVVPYTSTRLITWECRKIYMLRHCFLLKSRLQSHFVWVNCGVFWW